MATVAERWTAAWRAFKAAPATVRKTDEALGLDAATWAPSEYGTYLATSNAVYTCVTRRAELLARLPLVVMRRGPDGQDSPVEAGPLPAILDQPNPKYDGTWLVELTQMDLDLWGRAFWMLERGASGKGPIREMWRARPDQVVVVPSRKDYIAGFFLVDVDSGNRIPYTADEVIYFRYPNPVDELSGLSPLAAARLAADVGSAAMKANFSLFSQGMMGGGILTPGADGDKAAIWTSAQMEEIGKAFERQLKGVDKAHRWAIFRTPIHAERLSFSPEDMQHLETLKWSLEDVARAYRIPVDMLRGETTYENMDAAQRGVYTHAVLPAAWRMANVLNNTLVPLYDKTRKTFVAFDDSQVEVLQENRAEIVTQMNTLFTMGVPLNKLLSEFMPEMLPEDGDGYPWGDVAWMGIGLKPVSDAEPPPEPPAPPVPEPEPEPVEDEDEVEDEAMPDIPERMVRSLDTYGSREHREFRKAFDDKTRPFEKQFTNMMVELFHAQEKSVLAKLGSRGARLALADLAKLWSAAEWIRKTRERAHPLLQLVTAAGWTSVADTPPSVVDIVLGREQRFAQEVTDTTWDVLRSALAGGIEEGKGTDGLAEIVRLTFKQWAPDDTGKVARAEAIARTEVIGSYNQAGLAGAKSIGAEKKQWISVLDDRTRDDHIGMHGISVGVDEDFELPDGSSGPSPGDIGEASQDINCRCTMVYE